MVDLAKLYCLPITKATTIPAGTSTCIAKAFWVVHPDKGIVFYRYRPSRPYCAPQYNQDERVTRRLTERIYPFAEVRQLDAVYLQYRDEDGFLLPEEAEPCQG